MSDELTDAALEAEVVKGAEGDFPVVMSAVQETDPKAWFLRNGVDLDAILERAKQAE